MEFQRHKIVFLAVFLAGWVAYFGLLAFVGLLGFATKYGEIWLAISYQMLFVTLVSLPILILPMPHNRQAANSDISIIATMGIGLSAFAIICLWGGKITSGVDYSAGACIARNQMITMAEHRTGASITNVIGYIFGLSFFVSTAAVITQDTTRKAFWISMTASVGCLMMLSESAASRSTILLYFAFVAACIAIRLILGRSIPRIKISDITIAAILVAIAGWFVLAMFDCRALATGVTTKAYMNEFASFLGAQTDIHQGAQTDIHQGAQTDIHQGAQTDIHQGAQTDIHQGAQTDIHQHRNDIQPQGSFGAAYNRIVGLLGMTALYATHSAFTFAEIVDLPPDAGHIVFVFPMMLMARTGVIDVPISDWALAGRFTSLPGGLFHDFRLTGLIMGSLLLGLAIWFVIRLARQLPSNITVVGALAALITTAILSPVHSAFDFLGFPFLCFSFLIIPSLAYVLGLVQSKWSARVAKRTNS